MKVIGLTGNIGCGKSTVAGWLSEMGVAVIDLDSVARQIRNNDAEARRRIEARFGTIEAGKLAPIVFGDPAALRDLEAILHPLRTADSLTPNEVARLHRAIRWVLRQGINNRGTSFGDYVGADDLPGENAERLMVYQRTGEPCYRCGRPIQRMVIGQRSTHFCARCQKAPEPAGAVGVVGAASAAGAAGDAA